MNKTKKEPGIKILTEKKINPANISITDQQQRTTIYSFYYCMKTRQNITNNKNQIK